MLIVIPTKGRATKQITLRSLPETIRKKVFLCIYPEELSAHELYSNLKIVVPDTVKGIAQKREYILRWALKNGETKVVMLDDDLTFAVRRPDDAAKFVTASDYNLEVMFEEIERLLNTYPLVGVSSREGANRNTSRYIENTRIMRVLSYRADVLAKLGLSADTGDVMNDFAITLELLTRGLRVVNINWIVQNQSGSNATGGCSTYRTMEVQEAAARSLAARFPQFVKVVQKETKTAWGGQPRFDVIIQWKRAFEQGQQRNKEFDQPHHGHSHE